MSRRIGDDFLKLNSFFKDYTLSAYVSRNDQVDECKTMHKKLYGLLIFVAEFIHQTSSSQIISQFLDEMTSDLLLSLLNWVQGMYKPAKLVLRCSIENFLKALLSVTTPLIIEEKSVYAIFDSAKKDKHFASDLGKTKLEQIRNIYSILCRTVHSAPQEIHSTSSLMLLPKYDRAFSQELMTLFVRIIETSLGVLYLHYPAIVDKMHPENKKDFLDSLSKSTKTEISLNLYT